MFEVIKGKNEKYVEYTLKDSSSNSSAKVCPENGGMLISFIKDGYEYIWLDEENFYHGEKPSCANPVLFPNNGALENDEYMVNDKKYKLLQHGVARRNDWIYETSDTEDKASVTISLSANENTLKVYPFFFKLTFTYTLKANTVEIHQVYENLGEEEMPFNFGFHPYFKVSSVDNCLVNIKAENLRNWSPKGWDEDFTTSKEDVYKLDLSGGDNQIQFTGLSSPMKLVDEKNGKEVRVEFDENFKVAVVWSNNKEEFLCVEPWSNRQNGLNDDRHFTLKAKEKMERTVKFIVD